MEKWILILWVCLSGAGLLVLTGTFVVLSKVVGQRALMIIYYVSACLLQIIFLLGLVWQLNPFRMPRWFCVLQPLVFSFFSYVLTAVAVCFALGTYLVIKDFRQSGRGATSKRTQSPITYRPWMGFILVGYPVICMSVYTPLVISQDAIKPADDMHCDVIDPVWLRLLGYAGLNFVVSWPALGLSIYTSLRLFQVHRASLRVQRAARRRRKAQRDRQKAEARAQTSTQENPVPAYPGSPRTLQDETLSSDSNKLLPSLPVEPKSPILRSLRRISPPWMATGAQGTQTTLVGPGGGSEEKRPTSEDSHGSHQYPPRDTVPVLQVSLPEHAPAHFEPRSPSKGRNWDAQDRVNDARRPSAGSDEDPLGGGSSETSGANGGGALWRRALEKRWGPQASGVENGDGQNAGPYQTQTEIDVRDDVEWDKSRQRIPAGPDGGYARRGSIAPAPQVPALGAAEPNLANPAVAQSFGPALIFLLHFQVAFFVVELLTTISPILDVARGYPVPFGTQHIALILVAWGPFLVWYSAPPFRRVLHRLVDRFFPDSISSSPSDSQRGLSGVGSTAAVTSATRSNARKSIFSPPTSPIASPGMRAEKALPNIGTWKADGEDL